MAGEATTFPENKHKICHYFDGQKSSSFNFSVPICILSFDHPKCQFNIFGKLLEQVINGHIFYCLRSNIKRIASAARLKMRREIGHLILGV